MKKSGFISLILLIATFVFINSSITMISFLKFVYVEAELNWLIRLTKIFFYSSLLSFCLFLIAFGTYLTISFIDFMNEKKEKRC